MSNQSLILLPPSELYHAAGNPEASLLAISAKGLRDELIGQSSGIERVAGESSYEIALKAKQRLKGMMDMVETERSARTQPFYQLQRRINLEATNFVSTIQAEHDRLARLLSDYQQEQDRKELEAKAKAEVALAALQAQRLAAEAESVMATSQEQRDAAQEKILATDMKAAETLMSAPIVTKPEGVKVRYKYTIEVTDAAQLYKVFPELVNLEPKMREINSAARKMKDPNDLAGELPVLPGCKISRTVDVSAKG